jgi:hypothetical protein
MYRSTYGVNFERKTETYKDYRGLSKREKTKILDTFVSQTGYGRKYAIHLLANEGKIKQTQNAVRMKTTHHSGRKRVYPRVYDQAVLSALIPLWEAFNYQCGTLFAPFLHANIDGIAREKHFAMSEVVRTKLHHISAAVIDHLLNDEKAKRRIKGTSGTKAAKGHIKSLIPVMSHFECTESGSETDLVQHDGGNPTGEFCFTLTITEVKSAWTVHYALKNKAFVWIFKALNDAPIPVRILHSDNGSEFINHALKTWCTQHGITLTRSRGNRKNDNCFVKQKNGASVRKIVGYARFGDDRGVAALQTVYTHYDWLLNFFYSCQKLIDKKRMGNKVKKTYDHPQSPYDRILADTDTPQALKVKLRSLKKQINLMAEMKHMQQVVDKLPSLAEPVPVFISQRTLKPLLFGSLGSIS